MAEVYRVYRHYAISNQPALPDDAADLLKPEDWVWKNLQLFTAIPRACLPSCRYSLYACFTIADFAVAVVVVVPP